MRRAVQFFLFLVVVAAFFTATERQAHAYADPGSGMLLLQTAGSVVTAASIYFRRTIFGWFRRGKKTEETTESAPAPASK